MILVGCPVYKRDWILPDWFSSIEEAFSEIDEVPSYVFALDLRDETTHACITAHCDMRDRKQHILHVNDDMNRDTFRRDWNVASRIEWMSKIRNDILRAVRKVSPDYYLSVDSDILLHPRALKGMIEAINDPQWGFQAVGGKCYLGAGTSTPNFAYLDGRGSIKRRDLHYVTRVDALMAIKLMSPNAYAVDYVPHKNGEDIGWSLACKAQGLKLGYDGRTPSKHVMSLKQYGVYDKRVGY